MKEVEYIGLFILLMFGILIISIGSASANEVGTFTDLNHDIKEALNNSSGFFLEKDYKYNPDTDSKYKEGVVLKINKRIIIDGNGHTINGNNQRRIFYIDENCLVEFIDINFINGNANGWFKSYGGAIYSEPTLYITNCTFKNNVMKGIIDVTKGGAIYAEKDLYLDDSKFIDNSVTGQFPTFPDGGAVYSRGQVFASNCKFTRNHAEEDGGAIYSGNQVFATNCKFTRNHAEGDGGAVYISEGANVNHCRFYNNTAFFGACIYMDGNTELNCSFNKFNNNKGYGNAIYTYALNSRVRIYNNDFTTNREMGFLHTIYICGIYNKLEHNWWGPNHKYISLACCRYNPLPFDDSYVKDSNPSEKPNI